MHALRTSSKLARLVLAWFALALCAAVLSPVVQPRAMELVCTDGGSMKLVVVGDDGQAVPAGHHTLDCPACLGVLVPPAPVQVRVAAPQPPAHAPHRLATLHVAAPSGAPLPPRGPPSLS